MAHTDSDTDSESTPAKKALSAGVVAVLLLNIAIVKQLEGLPVRLIGYAITLALVLGVLRVLRSRSAQQADGDRLPSS